MPALSVFVNSPRKSLAASSLFAFGNWYASAVLSTDSGSLPNEVCAYFESKAYARAVRPAKVSGFDFFLSPSSAILKYL